MNIKSVKAWNVKDDKIKLGLFTVATCNVVTDNPITQCAKLIGLDNVQTYEELLSKGKNICLFEVNLNKVLHVCDVRNFDHLRVHWDSPVRHLSTIDENTKCLLLFEGHIGVITNINSIQRNKYTTGYRPLLGGQTSKKKVLCFDIECAFDSTSSSHSRHVPYLCCAKFIDGDENLVYHGENCILDMFEYVSTLGFKQIELIAHNGGGYDFHYILSSLPDPSIVENILIRNNSFISFSFKYKKVSFSVKDSFSFLLTSLDKCAKAFCIEGGKTDFPHFMVKEAEDLDKPVQRWTDIIQHINTTHENEVYRIKSENEVVFDPTGEIKSLREWAVDYCMNDVRVLADVWKTFKEASFDMFGVDVVDQSLTLAGMAFRLSEAHLPMSVKLYHPGKTDYDNMRSALIGGRCISVNGTYENISCLDVKSLYPAAMAFYDQPYGPYKKVKTVNEKALGIYYVDITPASNNGKTGYFPFQVSSGVTYVPPAHNVIGWYTSVDLQIAEEEGHKIEYVLHETEDGEQMIGYEWKHHGKIFKEYIMKLYTLKLKYEKEQNPVKRMIVKIIMNSLWGKFAQRWIDTSYSIKYTDEIDFESEEAYDVWNTDCCLVKEHTDKDVGSKPVQNGVFTLSWARYHMRKLWTACASPDAECIYSDTDSIFVDVSKICQDAMFELDGVQTKVIGDEVGQLEQECVFDHLMCAGKKQYIGIYDNGTKTKKRFKGVPQHYIDLEMYRHVLESELNYVEVSFLKFSRAWGVVSGYVEKKRVRST